MGGPESACRPLRRTPPHNTECPGTAPALGYLAGREGVKEKGGAICPEQHGETAQRPGAHPCTTQFPKHQQASPLGAVGYGPKITTKR